MYYDESHNKNKTFFYKKILIFLIWNAYDYLIGTSELLKGRQISKAIFLKTPLPRKRMKYKTKFYPMKLEQNLVHFFGNRFLRKNILSFTDLYLDLDFIHNCQTFNFR